MRPEELKKWRISLNLTQDKAARALDVSENCYWRWEDGLISPPPYLELACEAVLKGISVEPFTAQDLRKWRDVMGFTARQAGYALGITARTIVNWESGATAKIPYTASLACALLLDNLKNKDPLP